MVVLEYVKSSKWLSNNLKMSLIYGRRLMNDWLLPAQPHAHLIPPVFSLDRVLYLYFIKRKGSFKTDNNKHKPWASGEKPTNAREGTPSYWITTFEIT
jgi:hypothetical protein